MSYTLALTDVPDDKVVRRQIAAPLIEYNRPGAVRITTSRSSSP